LFRSIVRLAVFVAISPFLAVALVAAEDSKSDPGPGRAGPGPARISPVVVTADRIARDIEDVPAHVTVIDRERIDRSSAQTVDDLLRSVPGFHLFRRQTSLVANPTTQGVTMRGLGPNAASRALVLVDGVPLNDPFGGWVYWSKIPMESIERIELVRGGGSSVWGNSAMGGVIHVLTKQSSGPAVSLLAEGGNRGTADVQGIASERFGQWDVRIDGNYFHTDGFKLIASGDQVAFDDRANSEHGAAGIGLDRARTPLITAHGAARYFHVARDNGTRLTGN
jgi:iron complex outermembrane receptor protein